ncbi:MAG: hypothetical protein N3I86_03215 [Verrucomicrobiae bacterium]|nr:hypothetical protein [Verrucomicrobiae bacterium]
MGVSLRISAGAEPLWSERSGAFQRGRDAASPGATAPQTAHAPSIWLPLRFILTGLLALFAGLLGLVARPDLLATYHYNQHIIALTHLLVLGWLSSVAMGATYQLVPVALQTRLWSERLATWQFLLHVLGVGGMVWMFWVWNMKQVGHFGSVFALGVGLFVWNLARTLWRAPRRDLTALAIAGALGWLAAAILFGLAIAAYKCTYDSETGLATAVGVRSLVAALREVSHFMARFDQLGAMHAHAHLGAVGFFTLLIVGVSYKLVPMFALSQVQSLRRARLSIALLNVGLFGAFFTVLLRSPLKPLFALLTVAGLAIYAWELRAILRARKRPALDGGLVIFLTGVAWLLPVCALALVLSWPRLPLNTFTGQLENLYGFLGLLGFVTLAVIGMLYKIVPFLVWFGVYSRHVGLARVPAFAEMFSGRLQRFGHGSYLAGLLVVSAGILASQAPLVRAGAGLLVLGVGALLANVALMLRHLVRPQLGPPLSTKPADANAP